MSIDDYIRGFPRETQSKLHEIRSLIKRIAPDAVEKIAYQMPTYYLHGNLVHFAAYAKHIGFYPTPSGISAFQNELKAYKSAKGSVQFPLEKPLPVELIERIVRFRVKENTRKALAAKNKKARG